MRKAFILTGEKHFNPLPPHGGRRTRWRQSAETSRHFNPLPPHGGRQSSLNIFCIFNRHFNPLPPHGGRLRLIVVLLNSNRFQSTPSAWRETSGCTLPIQFHGISIHSLRMEGDSSHRSSPATPSLFQSTPSAWRETDDGFVYALTGKIFQSTPSAWRETLYS